MYLYERACRKFRHNKIMWKEYLEYLVKTKSMQKLNKVVSNAVLIHPDVLDFWLIGVYSELDMKGNLFSSRNLMLQALRVNENSSKFYTAYLRFEVRFLEKLMQRRDILAGPKAQEKGLDFIDESDGDNDKDGQQGEIKPGEEENLVKIVVSNLVRKFGKDAILLKEAKKILKSSKHITSETLMIISKAYDELKTQDPLSVLNQVYEGV